MPTYTYQCKKCGHTFDVFHAISASPRIKCESCGHRACTRLMGTGAGIIFKGSGFYETDYKDKKGKPASDAKPEKKSEGEAKAAGKSGSAGGNGKTGKTDTTKTAAGK